MPKKKAAKAAGKKANKIRQKKDAVQPENIQSIGSTEIVDSIQVPEQDKDEKKQTTGTPDTTKIIILGIIAVVILAFAYEFDKTAEVKGLEQKCLDVQNDPMLKYPCTCVPTARANDPNDTIDSKSDPMCTCDCYIEGVGRKVFEVRASK